MMQDEEKLFEWMVDNYIELNEGTLENHRLIKLNESLPDWIDHVETQLIKIGLECFHAQIKFKSES